MRLPRPAAPRGSYHRPGSVDAGPLAAGRKAMATKSKSHHKHHKKNAHHSESSPSHDSRKEHDRKAREHDQDVYAGGGVSKNMQVALVVVAALVVVTLTVMFLGGFINW